MRLACTTFLCTQTNHVVQAGGEAANESHESWQFVFRARAVFFLTISSHIILLTHTVVSAINKQNSSLEVL